MRIVTGKVVGNTVVVEGEPLPEGSAVTVWLDEPGGFELDDESIEELAAADAACARGEGISLEELTQRLLRVRAA